ncbi:MAG: extracellular solute-binding protein [Lachnospiraceae bacterium]|nr:extracellular solute-binding protein [Lachnospiraceae bacterium]
MKKILLLFLIIIFLTACTKLQNEENISYKEEIFPGLNYNKETLVLGLYPTIYNQLKSAIFDFNNTNLFYMIEIKEYENSNQLNIDIISGKTPDIILMPPYFMMDIYADRGVFTDLYPLLDNDLTIDRADLQENILKAYEINGQLLGMPINYVIDTLILTHSQIGEMYSWNLDEMIEFVNKQLPESKIFQNHNKSAIFDICLKTNGDVLIDWGDDGTFNRDLFLEILNFSNQFTSDYLYAEGNNIFDKIKDKQVQFNERSIGSVIFLQLLQQEFGEPIIFLGYPTEVGSGNIANSGILLAISQDCTNHQAAWSFISSMLTEEFQNSSSNSLVLPIRKSAIELHLRGIREGSWAITGTDIEFELYPATEDEQQQLRDLINSVTKTRSWDARIEDILREEAQSFLTGLKSAEEAADIAANRIEIYLNEFR